MSETDQVADVAEKYRNREATAHDLDAALDSLREARGAKNAGWEIFPHDDKWRFDAGGEVAVIYGVNESLCGSRVAIIVDPANARPSKEDRTNYARLIQSVPKLIAENSELVRLREENAKLREALSSLVQMQENTPMEFEECYNAMHKPPHFQLWINARAALAK